VDNDITGILTRRYDVVKSGGHTCAVYQDIRNFTAGQVLRFFYRTDQAISFQHADTAASVPARPSIYVELQQVTYTQIGPSGATGPTSYSGTSASSNSLQYGVKTFVTQANLGYLTGHRVLISDSSSPSRQIRGRVTSYAGTSLNVDVDTSSAYSDATSYNSWNIQLDGIRPYAGISSTPVAVATGSKSFTTQLNLGFVSTHRVVIQSRGTPSAVLRGSVTSYNSATGALVVLVDFASGTGTLTDWDIQLEGTPLTATVAQAFAATASNVLVTPEGLILSGTVPTSSLFGSISRAKYNTTLVAANPRGDGAVDLQSDRNAVTQVASGLKSVLIGGARNTASGDYTAVLAGFGNSATATNFATVINGGSNSAAAGYATIVNGEGNVVNSAYGFVGNGNNNKVEVSSVNATVLNGSNNLASNAYSAVLAGLNNTASGSNATVLCGNTNTAASEYGTILHGLNANIASTRPRHLAMAHAGRFSADGDCQYMSLIVRGATAASTTPVVLTSDGNAASSSNQLSVPTDKILTGIIYLHGYGSNGTFGSYVRRFSIYRQVNTTTLVGTVSAVGTDPTSNPASWVVSITANDTLDVLQIQCNTDGITAVRWAAYVDWIETTKSP
jgi:hypothetical protein